MSVHSFGPFELDGRRLVLSCKGKPLRVGPKVVETLLALVERAGQTMTKAELLDRIWPAGFVEESNLAQNVYVIRRVLRAHWKDAIQTIPRRGYRFVEPVRVLERPSAQVPVAPRTYAWRYSVAAAVLALFAILGLVHETARSRPQPVALSPAGAQFYTIGTYYWKHRTRDSLEKSLRYFRAALQTDPANARVYAALAQAYAIEGDYGFGPRSVARNYSLARTFAHRALALDPNSAEAHAALGIAEDRPETRSAAQREYVIAIALDPNYASAHQWYGSSLLEQGREREGYLELRKAAQLDPLSVATLAWLSEAAYFARQYTAAIGYAHQAIDLSPERSDVYSSLGLSYEAIGNYGAAEVAYRRFMQLKGCRAQGAALLAHAYAASHDFARAQAELADAKRYARAEHSEPVDLAFAQIALGQRPAALATLVKGRLMGTSPLLALEPRWDPVRSDGRFRTYVQAQVAD